MLHVRSANAPEEFNHKDSHNADTLIKAAGDRDMLLAAVMQ
jgi:hypothetical protein